jgi:tRNA1Val (adenine37-N6)-methyltransferase
VVDNVFESRLKSGEFLVELIRGGLKLIQSRQGYRFTMDAVLLAHFVAIKPGIRIADLGTGSGVIPLLLTTRAEDIRLIGFEIQPELAQRARRSVQINGLEKQIGIENIDLKSISDKYPRGGFEVVVCNPPYWSVGQGRTSPQTEVAIARTEMACTLVEAVEAGQWLLNPGGSMALVHLWERRQEVVRVLHRFGMSLYRWREVRHNPKTPPRRILVEAIKSLEKFKVEFQTQGVMESEMELRKMEPLYLYDLNSEFSPEVKAMYYG